MQKYTFPLKNLIKGNFYKILGEFPRFICMYTLFSMRDLYLEIFLTEGQIHFNEVCFY